MSKPTKMLLKITTADGKSFELVSPFDRRMEFFSIQWDESTDKIKFQAYIPAAHYLEKEKDVTFDEIYVHVTLDDAALITRVYSETCEIVLSKTYMDCPSQVTVKVITDFGAFCEATDDNLMKNHYG